MKTVPGIYVKYILKKGYSLSFERITQVTCGTPAMTSHFLAPLSYITHAVLTNIQNNIPLILVEQITRKNIWFLEDR
jgi:hypothetical protein